MLQHSPTLVVRHSLANFTTMYLDISAASVEVIPVPDIVAKCLPFPAVCSLKNIPHERNAWSEKVRSYLWKHTLEADRWSSRAAYYARITNPPASPPDQLATFVQ